MGRNQVWIKTLCYSFLFVALIVNWILESFILWFKRIGLFIWSITADFKQFTPQAIFNFKSTGLIPYQFLVYEYLWFWSFQIFQCKTSVSVIKEIFPKRISDKLFKMIEVYRCRYLVFSKQFWVFLQKSDLKYKNPKLSLFIDWNFELDFLLHCF